ncbi:MAG: Mitochondrial distribution and morphology protein 31, mitochondrial precursor [Cirrosporium novae-zelandiae]|nr:MAG: Mitochondrial distribution and morphology protein 31, mitochondrial precursor [Cirrosporium novae-zelandiae]
MSLQIWRSGRASSLLPASRLFAGTALRHSNVLEMLITTSIKRTILQTASSSRYLSTASRTRLFSQQTGPSSFLTGSNILFRGGPRLSIFNFSQSSRCGNERFLVYGKHTIHQDFGSLARFTQIQNAYFTSQARGEIRINKRNYSTSKNRNTGKTTNKKRQDDENALSQKVQDQAPKAVPQLLANKQLIDRLSKVPHLHRPTKEELLVAASGFWSRLIVRFKWFSIRSARPFNVDEIWALISWVLLGHVIWIIVGTTTFVSIIIFAVNTVLAQESLAKWVGNYLTKSSGVKVVFESAVVPKWKDGVITLSNVFVSRRPGQGQPHVTKGSPEIAAAVAAAAKHSEKPVQTGDSQEEEDDLNYTQFDLSIHTVNVTLSFAKWFNGHGLLREVEVKGVRGVVDRTNVHSTNDDPKSFRHEYNPGDFEIESFKLEDLLVTVHQPNNFRPFSVSIFSCDLPQLRKQWLFYDFLSANTMSGSFDNSLFTIHPRQTHSFTGEQLGENGQPNPWKKQTRLRIDSLNVDHLNTGVEGPFSWIHEGNVDIVADVMFPTDNDESIVKLVADFYDRLETTVASAARRRYLQKETINKEVELPENIQPVANVPEEDKKFVIMDLRVHLNDVRAAVPIFTRDISYVNNALIRPIVAYINSRRTFIPINCRIVKRLSEFDGSWTLYDSGLMDDLSAETYEAFAKDVLDDQARRRRIKKVGLWSLQLAIHAFFLGLAGNFA